MKFGEVEGTSSPYYYYEEGWIKFKQEALKRKTEGMYDELILSQLPSHNWSNFDGTIRSSILRGYGKPITVPVSPVIKLSAQEVDNVRKFSEKYNLKKFSQVILFECAPGSKQSSLNVEFALDAANKIVSKVSNVCFVLSTPHPISVNHSQIIDGSVLTFRENAELSKYCSLLIGCSSGITWLCTSDWAKKLNAIQIISSDFFPFPGVAYDLKLWGQDNNHIIEFYDNNKDTLPEILSLILNDNIALAKQKYHHCLRPEADNLAGIVNILYSRKEPVGAYFKVFSQILSQHRHIKSGQLLAAFIKKIWAQKESILNDFKNFVCPYNSIQFLAVRKIYRTFVKKK